MERVRASFPLIRLEKIFSLSFFGLEHSTICKIEAKQQTNKFHKNFDRKGWGRAFRLIPPIEQNKNFVQFRGGRNQFLRPFGQLLSLESMVRDVDYIRSLFIIAYWFYRSAPRIASAIL